MRDYILRLRWRWFGI